MLLSRVDRRGVAVEPCEGRPFPGRFSRAHRCPTPAAAATPELARAFRRHRAIPRPESVSLALRFAIPYGMGIVRPARDSNPRPGD